MIPTWQRKLTQCHHTLYNGLLFSDNGCHPGTIWLLQSSGWCTTGSFRRHCVEMTVTDTEMVLAAEGKSSIGDDNRPVYGTGSDVLLSAISRFRNFTGWKAVRERFFTATCEATNSYPRSKTTCCWIPVVSSCFRNELFTGTFVYYGPSYNGAEGTLEPS
jgi:hypothetical protein